MKLNYKKIWKRKSISDRILADFIGWKRKYFSYPLHRFKIERWYHLINRLQMIGLTKKQKEEIIILRQHYKHKIKTIGKKLNISNKRVLAVLYYYNCWKIQDWRDLFLMNITRESYSWFQLGNNNKKVE